MKLYGIELLDYDKANKYIKIINKTNQIEKDFIETEKFKSVYVQQYKEFNHNWSENIHLITLQDNFGKFHNYLTYIDLDDGYRSRGEYIEFLTDTPASTNMKSYNIDVTYKTKNYVKEENKNNELVIYYKKQILFSVGSENYDDWYPIGVCQYHPEILN